MKGRKCIREKYKDGEMKRTENKERMMTVLTAFFFPFPLWIPSPEDASLANGLCLIVDSSPLKFFVPFRRTPLHCTSV